MGNTRIIYLHPDEIFDRPYIQEQICMDEYKKMDLLDIECNKKENSVEFYFENESTMKIEVIDQDVLRLQILLDNECKNVEYKSELNIPLNNCLLNFVEKKNKIIIKAGNFIFDFDKQTQNFIVNNNKGKQLLQSIQGGIRISKEKPENSGIKSLGLFHILENENFFGFGGRTASPNRTGTSMDVFNIKKGVVHGDYGGCAVPFFMSTRGYGFFINNPWPHVYFDMGRTDKDEWFFLTPGGPCDIFIINGIEFCDIIKKYTCLTGRMPIPPKYLLGFWCSGLTIKNSNEVIEVAEKFRKKEIPCEGMIIDANWRVGPQFLEQYTTGKSYRSNNMEWSKDFGDSEEFLMEMRKNFFKWGLHLNNKTFSEETEEYGLKNHLLLRCQEDIILNFRNDKTYKFYEKLLIERIKEGVSIWWIDHSDRVSGEISDGIPSRNILGTLWCRMISKIMQNNGMSNKLSLSRGCGIGGQKYCIPWPGDTANGIENFLDDIWFCINAGLSGYPISSVDVGGFNLKHLVYGKKKSEYYCNCEDIDKEVFEKNNILRRVCQELFFIPLPRLHNNWCTKPKLPWNCNAKEEEVIKEYLLYRYKLIPYIYSTAIHSSMSGEPILRPLVYKHLDDNKVYKITDQFYMGDSLLIAPITEPDIIKRKVYLPKGKWFYYWDSQVYNGGVEIEVEAPFYSVKGLPIFVKENSIIASQRECQYAEQNPPYELFLDFYFGDRMILNLYEGENICNKLSCVKYHTNSFVITLENNIDSDRKYILKLHGVKCLKKIKALCNVETLVQLKDKNKSLIHIDITAGSVVKIYGEYKAY